MLGTRRLVGEWSLPALDDDDRAVGMVEQAGTGATAAGPMLKRIWDGIFGVGDKPVIAESQPETRLPKIQPGWK